MGILSFYLGIGNLGLLEAFPHLFMIGNSDTFLFLERVRKPCLTIFEGRFQDYYENGKSLHLVRTFIVFLIFFYITIALLMIYVF